MNWQRDEQLAELCGALKGGYVEYSLATGVPRRRATYAIKGQIIDQSDWNPTTDLNQLRMCYEAAEKAVGDEFHARFYIELTFALVEKGFNRAKDLTAAWVKHPELVAQAILKAKGVS